MRMWLALAVLLGGCSQSVETMGLITGSIAPPSSSAAPSPVAKSKAAGAERISGNLYRVLADDRKLPDRIERENYTLLKAAEATKAAGGTHFVLVSASDQSPIGVSALSLSSSGSQYGAYFRILEIDATAGVPTGAMAVDEIIHFFGPKFGRAPTDAT